jgi:diacylglycerol kinase family enzyme
MQHPDHPARMRRIFAVLNKRAGTLMDADPAAVKQQVETAFAGEGRSITVELASGPRICRAIDRAVASDFDTIIVGGGDGSANYAAGKLAGTALTLGVLPLGTMNLLARDLQTPTVLEDALIALRDGIARPTDLATLNGRPFHTLSGVGFFSQMARAREETRDLPGRVLRMTVAAFRAFNRAGRFSLEIEIDGQRQQIDAFAVLVTNNSFSGEDWRRVTLEGGTLEVHIAEERGALGKIKAGADLLTGSWRNNPGIHSFTAQRVRISTGRERTWVSTDGELSREQVPLDYAVMPRALSLLIPRTAAAKDAAANAAVRSSP